MHDMFQSTRPRGARRAFVLTTSTMPAGFNPRAHAGRDVKLNDSETKYLDGFNPRAHAGRDLSHAKSKMEFS